MTTLALELRRGPAPLLALALLALAGTLVLGDAAECGGGWPEAVLALRDALGVAVPSVLAAGVWQGGIARRRGVDDALAAAPLPVWHRSAVEGGSLALAGVGTLAVLLATQVVAGGCTSGLGNASAAAMLGASVLAVMAAAFAGLALGRHAAAPMAAPLALFTGLVVTMVLGGWSPDGAWAMLLLPAIEEGLTVRELGVRASIAQSLWFAGLALSGWLWASRWPARSRLLRAVPAAAGLAALAALAA